MRYKTGATWLDLKPAIVNQILYFYERSVSRGDQYDGLVNKLKYYYRCNYATLYFLLITINKAFFIFPRTIPIKMYLTIKETSNPSHSWQQYQPHTFRIDAKVTRGRVVIHQNQVSNQQVDSDLLCVGLPLLTATVNEKGDARDC